MKCATAAQNYVSDDRCIVMVADDVGKRKYGIIFVVLLLSLPTYEMRLSSATSEMPINSLYHLFSSFSLISFHFYLFNNHVANEKYLKIV
jgi:hypothetical protein